MPQLNNLVKESNYYLQKHSNDPIEWFPWCENAFKSALKENKPIFLNIGYMACHWCNVMSKESFSDKEIAKILNKNFINIKVDKEERPDIDKFYTNSLLSMGINSGWPLNVFLLPDGRPFYGGTYFDNVFFKKLIIDISNTYLKHKIDLEKATEEFIQKSKFYKSKSVTDDEDKNELSVMFCENLYKKIYKYLDNENGGLIGDFKFPLAELLNFLLVFNKALTNTETFSPKIEKDFSCLNALNLMLEKISDGGIYDHIEGGIHRYSIDSKWHVPHFEKMLYDNGQIISIYSKFYKNIEANQKYKKIVYDTISFLDANFLDNSGGYYCSMSSDSEGEEGKYYVWTQKEILNILGNYDGLIFSKYYNITLEGNWKPNKNILFKQDNIEPYILEKFLLDKEELEDIIESCRLRLHKHKQSRIKPEIDKKIITSWNAILLIGFLDAYHAFNDQKFLQKAIELANFLDNKLIKGDYLWHNRYNNKNSHKGYLEDYAWIIKALLYLFCSTLDEKWCIIANQLLRLTLDQFYDEQDGFFFFSSLKDGNLFSNKKYNIDNSIASANSIMCENLYAFGKLYGVKQYISISEKMLKKMLSTLAIDPTYFLKWSFIVVKRAIPQTTVIIIGPKAKEWVDMLNRNNLLNVFIIGSENIKPSQIPILSRNFKKTRQTYAYICKDNYCENVIYDLQELIRRL